MTNGEKYKDEILEVAMLGKGIALDTSDNKIKNCINTDCAKCKFSESHKDCTCLFADWLFEEYQEPKIQEAIKNCKVDDKVMVSTNGWDWEKRYFANYDDVNEVVYCFNDGCTSWTTNRKSYWKYARLPKEDEL